MKKAALLITLTICFYVLLSFVYAQFKSNSGANAEQSTTSQGENDVLNNNNVTAILPAKVDFDAYELLLKEAKEHRKARLVNLDEFLKMGTETQTMILDTRSDAMYNSKHIKGAVHLNFSDFTQENLAKFIPSIGTRVLIYCNNNFKGDQKYFASKAFDPALLKPNDFKDNRPPVTLALNIPTFINLFGYGYRNLYELSELVDVMDERIVFEGSAVN